MQRPSEPALRRRWPWRATATLQASAAPGALLVLPFVVDVPCLFEALRPLLRPTPAQLPPTLPPTLPPPLAGESVVVYIHV
jgi:hypothetical protein